MAITKLCVPLNSIICRLHDYSIIHSILVDRIYRIAMRPLIELIVFLLLLQAPDKSVDSVDKKRSPSAHFADCLAAGSGESVDGRDPVAGAGQPHNIRDPVQGPADP